MHFDIRSPQFGRMLVPVVLWGLISIGSSMSVGCGGQPLADHDQNQHGDADLAGQGTGGSTVPSEGVQRPSPEGAKPPQTSSINTSKSLDDLSQRIANVEHNLNGLRQQVSSSKQDRSPVEFVVPDLLLLYLAVSVGLSFLLVCSVVFALFGWRKEADIRRWQLKCLIEELAGTRHALETLCISMQTVSRSPRTSLDREVEPPGPAATGSPFEPGRDETPQGGTPPAQTPSAEFDIRQMCRLYNEGRKSDASRQEFSHLYNPVRLRCINDAERVKNPDAEPEFRSAPNGIYLAVEAKQLGVSCFAVIPWYGTLVDHHNYGPGALGYVYDCRNYEPRRESVDFTLVQPAYFVRGGTTWQLQSKGVLEVSGGTADL